MNVPTTQDTQTLHSQYRALTGLEVPYTMQLHYMWESWIVAGFSEPDLACVIRYIKARIKEGKRPKESLLPRNLIQRIDFFGEDLAISRAENRNKVQDTPRKEILRATGRATEQPTSAKPVRDVLKESIALENFRAWRTEAGL